MQNGEKVGCRQLPTLDQAMTALISPSQSVLGKAICSSRKCRAMDDQLTRMHTAMAVHGIWQKKQSDQYGSIHLIFSITLYLRYLSLRQQDEQGMDEQRIGGHPAGLSLASLDLYGALGYITTARQRDPGFLEGAALGSGGPTTITRVPSWTQGSAVK